jgi:hypothetical protein
MPWRAAECWPLLCQLCRQCAESLAPRRPDQCALGGGQGRRSLLASLHEEQAGGPDRRQHFIPFQTRKLTADVALQAREMKAGETKAMKALVLIASLAACGNSLAWNSYQWTPGAPAGPYGTPRTTIQPMAPMITPTTPNTWNATTVPLGRNMSSTQIRTPTGGNINCTTMGIGGGMTSTTCR